ncbi:hypothetical protein E2C01_012789 [Portunus trituberculatus]|uniref:Uncharacterized protein n=1 Tax=Portunus trituberculatus TaxID=210409 RepID=A0A5B7DEY3_PORTR|nr:hypothetical protein [Portunus trituberculatus]
MKRSKSLCSLFPDSVQIEDFPLPRSSLPTSPHGLRDATTIATATANTATSITITTFYNSNNDLRI